MAATTLLRRPAQRSPLPSPSPSCSTALHHAAHNGRTFAAQELANAGANLTARTHAGRTPLHCATFEGHVATVQALLEKGAPVYAQDNDGATALHLAGKPWKDQEPLIKALLSSGADPKASDKCACLSRAGRFAAASMRGCPASISAAPSAPCAPPAAGWAARRCTMRLDAATCWR